MKNYLPRFTLRRALIAVALLALFLGWLRPDRAKVHNSHWTQAVEFEPMWPACHIEFKRTLFTKPRVLSSEPTYRVECRFKN